MPRTVLFLCTGNYYRSRFAEVLFCDLAAREQLDWRATSRGLRIGWPGNLGAVSPHTERRLAKLGLDWTGFRHMPMQCRECDLAAADRVVALKEAEHRPMLRERFSPWEDRVTYWHVHDVDAAHPEDALDEIEQLVRALVSELKTKAQP
jgi:low molecular weight protein-tyrosine phosphatase